MLMLNNSGVWYFTFRIIYNRIPLIVLTIKYFCFKTNHTILQYSKRIINAVNYAKHRGADVIALTDSQKSPIAADASQLLIAESDMASFVDSLVAPLSIINAMVVAVAREKKDELAIRLRRLEEIWDEYDVYDKTHI